MDKTVKSFFPEPKNYTYQDAEKIWQRLQYIRTETPHAVDHIINRIFGAMQSTIDHHVPKNRYAARLFFEKLDDILKELDPEKNTRAVVTNADEPEPVKQKRIESFSENLFAPTSDLRADLDPTNEDPF